MRWLLLICSLFLACSSSDLIVHHPPSDSPSPARVWPILVDDEFTYDQAVEVEKAVRIWETALNGLYEFRVRRWHFDPADVLSLEEAGQGVAIMSVPAAEMPGDNVLAYVNGLGGHRMFISMERIGTRSLKGVAIHEMGHSLGLGHIPVRGAAMYPSYDDGWNRDCIDEVTMRVLAEVDSRVKMDHIVYCRIP